MFKTLLACSALTIVGAGSASALSLATPTTKTDARILLVAGGCGPAFHRNPYGDCVPNGFFAPAYGRLPPPCPRGYHRDPDPRRRLCYPNF